jgi:outer membrane protein assembly factor BamB
MGRLSKTSVFMLILFLTTFLTAVNNTLAQVTSPEPTPTPAPTPTMLWQFTPHNYLGPGEYAIREWSTPTIANGIVYVCMSGSRTYDKEVLEFGTSRTIKGVQDGWGGIYALNATTGGLRWFFTTEGSPFRPAVGGNKVFSPVSYTQLGAFNISNGGSVWNYTLPQPSDPILGPIQISSSPAFFDGRVFFGSTDSNILALNASTGKTLWTFATDPLYQPGKTTLSDNAVLSTPAVANGVVYVYSRLGYSYALNESSGSKLWSYNFSSGGFVDRTPVILEGRVYFSAFSGQIFSLNVTDGSKIWNYSCGYEWVSTPNYDNMYWFVSPITIDDNVVFFNYNGVVGWKDGSYKYFGTVCALNALNGIKIWNNTMAISTSGAQTASNGVAVHNGVVYVFSDDQRIYGLNAMNGEILWNFSLGKSVFSSQIENNVAYYGPDSDSFYSLELPSELATSPTPTPYVPEPFPLASVVVAVSVVIIAVTTACFLIYFKKRKH